MASSAFLFQDWCARTPMSTRSRDRETDHDHEQAMDLREQAQRAGLSSELQSPGGGDAAAERRRSSGAHDVAVARSGKPRLDDRSDLPSDVGTWRGDGRLG